MQLLVPDKDGGYHPIQIKQIYKKIIYIKINNNNIILLLLLNLRMGGHHQFHPTYCNNGVTIHKWMKVRGDDRRIVGKDIIIRIGEECSICKAYKKKATGRTYDDQHNFLTPEIIEIPEWKSSLLKYESKWEQMTLEYFYKIYPMGMDIKDYEDYKGREQLLYETRKLSEMKLEKKKEESLVLSPPPLKFTNEDKNIHIPIGPNKTLMTINQFNKKMGLEGISDHQKTLLTEFKKKGHNDINIIEPPFWTIPDPNDIVDGRYLVLEPEQQNMEVDEEN